MGALCYIFILPKTGISEKTGQKAYIHFDGTPADGSETTNYYLLPNCCGTVESYISAFNSVSQRIEHLIGLTQIGRTWADGMESSMPSYVNVEFRYPNGKRGDIDFFIATEFGEVTGKSGINYKAVIPTSEKDQIAKMMFTYDVRHELIKDITGRTEISAFLNKYNLYHQLRQLADEFILIGGPQYHPLRNKARCIAGDYIDAIRDQRNKVYSYLVANKLTTGRWKSEQKAYAIVRDLFPDALYQFKADWLGYQSLDIFVPCRMTAIEYQGLQHYKSVDVFGGEDGFRRRQELDAKKRELCERNGVRLIYLRYDEPITEEYIKGLFF